MNSLSIIIPTHNRLERLLELLTDIKQQASSFSEVEVLVLNSAAGVDSRNEVESMSSKDCEIRYLLAENALSRKRNVGAEVARHTNLVFLDDDMRLEAGYLVAMMDMLAASPEAVVCSEVEFYSSWIDEQNYYKFKSAQHVQTVQNGEELAPNRFVAMSFAISKPTYLLVGGFDEDFVRYGGEDQAFAYQCLKADVPIYFCKMARSVHAEVRSGPVVFSQKIYDAFYYSMPILFDKWVESRTPISSAIPLRIGHWLIRLKSSALLSVMAYFAIWFGNRICSVLDRNDRTWLLAPRTLYLALILLFSCGGYWDSLLGYKRRSVGSTGATPRTS